VARKQDPNDVLAEFTKALDRSLAVWQSATSQVATADLRKQLSVDALQRLAIALEEFRSDWHFAAINRDSSKLRDTVETSVREIVRRNGRYGAASEYVQVTMGHLKVADLRQLLVGRHGIDPPLPVSVTLLTHPASRN